MTLEDVQAYLHIPVGDSVTFQDDEWYSVSALERNGISIEFHGKGYHRGVPTRRVFYPYEKISIIYEYCGNIVMETPDGVIELRTAYTEKEMREGYKVDESKPMTVMDILDLFPQP